MSLAGMGFSMRAERTVWVESSARWAKRKLVETEARRRSSCESVLAWWGGFQFGSDCWEVGVRDSAETEVRRARL